MDESTAIPKMTSGEIYLGSARGTERTVGPISFPHQGPCVRVVSRATGTGKHSRDGLSTAAESSGARPEARLGQPVARREEERRRCAWECGESRARIAVVAQKRNDCCAFTRKLWCDGHEFPARALSTMQRRACRPPPCPAAYQVHMRPSKYKAIAAPKLLCPDSPSRQATRDREQGEIHG